MKWWSRWVPPPYKLACRASALLVCHDPMKIGKPPWCCPRQAEFWRLCCTSWCAAYWIAECTKVRRERASKETGAVAGSRTRTCALARRHSPLKSQPRKLRSPGASFALRGFAISTKNKHLLLSCDTNPRFHGGSFGVLGHTSSEALKL